MYQNIYIYRDVGIVQEAGAQEEKYTALGKGWEAGVLVGEAEEKDAPELKHKFLELVMSLLPCSLI